MLKIILSNQNVIEIRKNDLLHFYDVVNGDEGYLLKLMYENSLDNKKKERVTFNNGTTSVSGEMSTLMVHNQKGYEGVAVAFSTHEYFNINDESRLVSCRNVVEIINDTEG